MGAPSKHKTALAAKTAGGKGKNGFRLNEVECNQWHTASDAVQRNICSYKIKHYAEIRSALLATGNDTLLHQDNRAQADTPWGGRVCKKTGEIIGQNKLGILWMEARSNLLQGR